MTVATTSKPSSLQSYPHRWTRREFEMMAEIDLFSTDARLELIEGEILEMAAHTSHHATAIVVLQRHLEAVAPANCYLRVQLPLALTDDSEPEPDIAVVAGTPENDWNAHPRSAVLVVEVAYSSLDHDQERKQRLYAFAQIPEYWILNLGERQLEVYRDPRQGNYQTRLILAAGATISPLMFSNIVVAVADLLPPA